MKTAFVGITLFWVASIAQILADVPRKMAPAKLAQLCDEFIFSSKPEDPPPPPSPDPVKDYTLAGVARIEDGWFVVLMHKGDRSMRVRLTPHGFTESGFRVVAVENPGTRQVRVQIAAGEHTGWVRLEPKFLTVRKPALRKAWPKVVPGNLKGNRANAAKVRRVPVPPPPDKGVEGSP